jgi:hypothetical protein
LQRCERRERGGEEERERGDGREMEERKRRRGEEKRREGGRREEGEREMERAEESYNIILY